MNTKNIPLAQHNIEIAKNLDSWKRKPLLQKIYRGFYDRILPFVRTDISGEVLELGSGIGNFKEVYPKAIATDIFPNPWIDRVETAYNLSGASGAVSSLILFDVFHHLAYPGFAFKEFHRALALGGRVIIFDPYISLLGFFVYGALHHEPVGLREKISWMPEGNENPDGKYYAAQGNATRIFKRNSKQLQDIEKDWKIVAIKKYADISYVLSGGFSKPALYPQAFLSLIKRVDAFLDFFPFLFGTRMLIVLEKK